MLCFKKENFENFKTFLKKLKTYFKIQDIQYFELQIDKNVKSFLYNLATSKIWKNYLQKAQKKEKASSMKNTSKNFKCQGLGYVSPISSAF